MLRATGRKTVVLGVTIPKPLDEAIRVFAESRQIPLSWVASDAIRTYLRGQGVDVPEPGAPAPRGRKPRPARPIQEAVPQ